MKRQLLLKVAVIFLLPLVHLTIVKAQEPADKEATTAKTKNTIATVRLVDVKTTGSLNPYIVVNLTDPLDDSASAEMVAVNFIIKFMPSGKVVPASAIVPGAGLEGTMILPGYNNKSFQIEIKPDSKPNPGDTQVQLTVLTLTFAGKSVQKNLKSTGKIYNESNKNTLADDVRANAKKAAASAKTSDEKNIFAGLNVAVPSGGKTAGDADIHFNKVLYGADIALPSLFDQLNFGLHLKKGTANHADPRHFETGLTMRKTFLLVDRKALNQLRNDINAAGAMAAEKDPRTEAILEDLGKLRRGFFRAILFDNAFRFEGDVKGLSVGNVSNLLYDSQLQVSTVSQALGGTNGFFNLRLIPVGLEAGYNITNNDLKGAERQSLVRVKAGVQFNLHYQAENPADFLNRIELEVKGVDRYLFRREAAFDDATKKAIFTNKGNTYWIQSDLKFLFGGLSSFGQAGFKLSFNRGSLPPVYAFNKSFTLGLIFQSKDSDTSKEIKLK